MEKMTVVPGKVGYPILGDKSVEFYRDAIAYVQRKIEELNSRVFRSRFLNQPSVFVASNKCVQEMLADEGCSMIMGYKQFMEGIYGQNVLFSDDEDAQTLRTKLHQLLLSEMSINLFNTNVDRISLNAIENLPISSSIPIYAMLKKMCTEICLSLFLGIDFEESSELAEQIIELTKLHWHGIISVPVNFRMPVMGSKSTYGKALQAKEKLISIIEAKLNTRSSPNTANANETFADFVNQCNFKTPDLAINHVLLFTSALVPKAFASLLTSFMLITAQNESLQHSCRESEETLNNVLLEVQRLWPPFIGGRRIVSKTTELEGHHIPEGHAVIFMTYHAHRDPDVFSNPDEFMPERWKDSNMNDENKLFTFGGGTRCCIGKHMAEYLLKTVCGNFLQKYTWTLTLNQDLSFKWLPVSRPKHDVSLNFTQRT